ncbi:hypothetical protein SFRURICE_012646 [Spodoptera frugiperda]|nr:hypothetical protein SFRURICE_012646 [Spodoptera frugiperda]
MTGPIFRKSWKGKRILQIAGSSFNLVNFKGKRSYWYCNQWAKGCRASVITSEDVIIKMRDEHNHTGPVFSYTIHGKPSLEVNQYRFNFKYKAGAQSYWACNKAWRGCRVAVITIGTQIVHFFTRIAVEEHISGTRGFGTESIRNPELPSGGFATKDLLSSVPAPLSPTLGNWSRLSLGTPTRRMFGRKLSMVS